MTAEAITVALLRAAAPVTALVADRIFPIVLPDGQITPALVFDLIVGVETGNMGTEDDPGVQRSRVELEGFAEDVETAKVILRTARKALLYKRGDVAGCELVTVEPGAEGPNYWDPARKLFACTGQVFMTWREI